MLDNSTKISKYDRKYSQNVKKLCVYSALSNFSRTEDICETVCTALALPKMNIEVNSRLKRVLGRYYYNVNRIELQNDKRISLETLAHEIAHGYSHIKHHSTGHNATFFHSMEIVSKSMLEVVEKMNLTPDLNYVSSLEEIATIKENRQVRVGQKVTFRAKGQIFVGIVQKLNTVRFKVSCNGRTFGIPYTYKFTIL